VEEIGDDAESLQELADFAQGVPGLRDHMLPLTGPDALQANLNLIETARNAESNAMLADWQAGEIQQTQHQQYLASELERAVEHGWENPQDVPQMLVGFLQEGGDISQAAELIEAGDAELGPGATVAYASQVVAGQQQALQAQEQQALYQQAQAEAQRARQEAVAVDARAAAMEAPAIDLVQRNPEAAELIRVAFSDPEVAAVLQARMTEPQKAAEEFRRWRRSPTASLRSRRRTTG
jgi:hypothetical protein